MITKLNYSIILYKGVGLRESDNAIIDDYSTFLVNNSSGEGLSFTNIQPITISEEFELKLPITEETIGDKDYKQYKIAKITALYNSTEESIFYCFITFIERLANNVLLLHLKLDLLNTYGEYITSTDTTKNIFSPKTIIKRQHEDRFGYKTYNSAQGVTLLGYKIDKISEGLNVPKKILSRNNVLEDVSSSYQNLKWYLVYETQEEITTTSISAIDTYLYSNTSMLLKEGTSSTPIYFNVNIMSGFSSHCFYILASDGAYTIDVKLGSSSDYTTYTNLNSYVIKFYYSTNPIIYIYDSNGNIINNGTFNNLRFTSVAKCRVGEYVSDYNLVVYQNMPLWNITSNKIDSVYSLPIDSYQKTNPKLVKIIELPYCPRRFSVSSNVFSVNNFYIQPENTAITSPVILAKFKSAISNQELTNINFADIDILNYTESIRGQVLPTSARFLLDPKLYHSDFYVDKFVYDSFSLEIKHEDLEPSSALNSSTPYFSIEFKTTNTINSNLGFKISTLRDDALITEYNIRSYNTDYEDFVISTRNNEVTIYNNSYVDYLKTGYNYDKKSKAIQSVSRWANAGLNIGSNPSSMAGNLLNAITGQLQAENSFAQKINELQYQATQVSGSDDIDLLSWYNGNKLLHIIYEPYSQYKTMLDDLFYYYGYTRNYQGKPNFKSRTWFNYVECEPQFLISTSKFIPEEYISSITQKLIQGVTNYHHYASTWDLDQVKENVETSLL